MSGSYAPVILFVYNRPKHVKKNIAILNDCDGVEDTDLIVFSDASKDEMNEQLVKQVREELIFFKMNSSKFRSMKIIEATQNKGLAQSIITGVSEIINQYGKVIVLEDDLVVSKDFLIYMNQALEYYYDKNNIWSISGYTFPMKALEKYPHDIYLALRGCSWGWGTWKDRWEMVDWKISDYEEIKYSWKNRLEFGRWGRDMPFMLDANYYGLNQSWAIRWCYSAYKYNKYTVYPVESRVKSNGTDGSGTNYIEEIHRYDTALKSENAKVMFEIVVPNKQIEREFRKKHKKFLGVVRDHYKWLLIKRGILKIKGL